MSARAEEVIARSMLETLADTKALFVARAVEWRKDARAGGSETGLDIGRYASGAELEVHLDVEFTDGSAVSWVLEGRGKESEWMIEASLRKSFEHGQRIVEEVPTETVKDVLAFLRALPRVAQELLKLTPFS